MVPGHDDFVRVWQGGQPGVEFADLQQFSSHIITVLDLVDLDLYPHLLHVSTPGEVPCVDKYVSIWYLPFHVGRQ